MVNRACCTSLIDIIASQELTALPSEIATLPALSLNLFLEPREAMVRMFHAPVAHWARGGEVLSAHFSNAREGEFFTFQVRHCHSFRCLFTAIP